jgi:hypothetical protein
MVVAGALQDFYRESEQVSQRAGLEDVLFGAIAVHSAISHQNHSVDLGDDVGEMVGHENQADAIARELAEDLAEVVDGAEIEARGRFVEDERLRVVNERSADEDAAGFSGRHLVGGAVGEMGDFEEVEHVTRFALHLGGDFVPWPDADAAEEAGEDDLVTGVVAGAELHPVVGDDAELTAEIVDMPSVAAEDFEAPGFGLETRIEFAGDQLDEGRFAGAVRAQDHDVFALGDGEGDVVEDGLVAALDGDVLEIEEGGPVRHFV